MAKISFIQKSWFDIHGPMCISALLKKHERQTQLLVEPAERDLEVELKNFKPDVLAFSLVPDKYQWAAGLANSIRRMLNIPIVFGGIHPTFCPEECSANACVDIVCRGEGEYAMLETPDRNRLINLHKFFQTAVLFPSLMPLIKQLVKIPPNPLFQLWFGFFDFFFYVRSEGRGWVWAVRSALKNWHFFGKK